MHQPFRFGVVISNAPSRTAFVTLARRAGELGYATLLMPDRTITGLAPLTALAVAAEATTSLRIGSYVFCNGYRHPALLAKEVATLDFLSGGRFELGLSDRRGFARERAAGLPVHHELWKSSATLPRQGHRLVAHQARVFRQGP